jgi:glutathione S-transferase
MILYGASVSPFVRKVLAYASEKGIELELVPVGIGDPNPDFVAISPFKKMPALKDGDFGISDSTAIITYLEAKHPEPAMLPADPANRARVIWFEEFADTILTAAAGPIFFNLIVAPMFLKQEGDMAAVENAKTNLMPPALDYLEGVIPASGFLVGDAFSLADIAVASPFVNAAHCDVVPDAAKYPKLSAYLAAIHARPSMGDWIRRERKMLGKG